MMESHRAQSELERDNTMALEIGYLVDVLLCIILLRKNINFLPPYSALASTQEEAKGLRVKFLLIYFRFL